jgi:hypothetical protein
MALKILNYKIWKNHCDVMPWMGRLPILSINNPNAHTTHIDQPLSLDAKNIICNELPLSLYFFKCGSHN